MVLLPKRRTSTVEAGAAPNPGPPASASGDVIRLPFTGASGQSLGVGVATRIGGGIVLATSSRPITSGHDFNLRRHDLLDSTLHETAVPRSKRTAIVSITDEYPTAPRKGNFDAPHSGSEPRTGADPRRPPGLAIKRTGRFAPFRRAGKVDRDRPRGREADRLAGQHPVYSTLVSTGLPAHPTPTGVFHVYEKLPSDLMTGPGYYLPKFPT